MLCLREGDVKMGRRAWGSYSRRALWLTWFCLFRRSNSSVRPDQSSADGNSWGAMRIRPSMESATRGGVSDNVFWFMTRCMAPARTRWEVESFLKIAIAVSGVSEAGEANEPRDSTARESWQGWLTSHPSERSKLCQSSCKLLTHSVN